MKKVMMLGALLYQSFVCGFSLTALDNGCCEDIFYDDSQNDFYLDCLLQSDFLLSLSPDNSEKSTSTSDSILEVSKRKCGKVKQQRKIAYGSFHKKFARGPNVDINFLFLESFKRVSEQGNEEYSCPFFKKNGFDKCSSTFIVLGNAARFAQHIVRHVPKEVRKKILICDFCQKQFDVFQWSYVSRSESYRRHVVNRYISKDISLEKAVMVLNSAFNKLLWEVLLIREEKDGDLKKLDWLSQIRPPEQQPLAEHEKVFSKPSAIMIANTGFIELDSDQESL